MKKAPNLNTLVPNELSREENKNPYDFALISWFGCERLPRLPMLVKMSVLPYLYFL